MGIDLSWQDERGRILEKILDPNDNGLKIVESDYTEGTSCLRFIDPYGDTTFNQQQIETLIEELKSAQRREKRPAVRHHIEKWYELALRSSREIHTYLKFLGD